MSRWNKGRGPSVAVPLESLIKEIEKTNRPSVARSAGTVGKWGVTSFTSIRSSFGGLSNLTQYSPRQESANCSPQSGDYHLSTSVSVPEPPKPRKFFKSRDKAPELLNKSYPAAVLPSTPLPRYQHQHSIDTQNANVSLHEQQQSVQQNVKPKPVKLKIKKPAKEKVDKVQKEPKRKKEKKEKIKKVVEQIDAKTNEDGGEVATPVVTKKATKAKVQKVTPENPNKRTSSRTRNKVVNYNEDDDDNILSLARQTAIKFDKNSQDDTVEVGPTSPLDIPIVHETQLRTSDQSPSQRAPVNNHQDHPPIVLRISKGTSRLISTDSEDIQSPPHQSSAHSVGALASTAELLAVLSDHPVDDEDEEDEKLVNDLVLRPPTPPPISIVEQIPEPEDTSTTTTATTVVPKLENLKIKIKTNKVKAEKPKGKRGKQKEQPPTVIIVKPVVEKVKLKIPPSTAGGGDQINSSKNGNRVTRSSRRNKIVEHQPEEPAEEEEIPPAPIQPPIHKSASPLPGTENYDLYRTLVASPEPSEEKEFDSQSSILGSISSKETQFVTTAVGPEDSRVIHSRGSSDLATSDIDTSQSSSVLAAPPSEIHANIFSESETEQKDVVALISTPPQAEIQITENLPAAVTTDTTVGKKRATRRGANMKSPPPTIDVNVIPAVVSKTSGRVTRNNNNITSNSAADEEPTKSSRPIRSYRKRKNVQPVEDESNLTQPASPSATNLTSPSSQTTIISSNFDQQSIPNTNSNSSNNNWSMTTAKLSENDHGDDPSTTVPAMTTNEPRLRNKIKKTWYDQDVHSNDTTSTTGFGKEKKLQQKQLQQKHDYQIDSDGKMDEENSNNHDGNEKPTPSVKLLISKKKGSIFKSRSLVPDQEGPKKRHVYKHKWTDDSKDKTILSADNMKSDPAVFDDFDGEPSGNIKMMKLRKNVDEPVEEHLDESVTDEKRGKSFVTVRNVKKAHQIQEIGESQEMDDDVEYLLDALQPHNPISTRCLSAIQLAQKCMTPAFRMHVRAHGTVTKFFNALHDATKDQSLGLCTATVMFVLSQDNLNMDLDRDSLELMLNLLESDISHKNVLNECSLSQSQIQKHLLKVRELCEDIKSQGKAAHLNFDNITVGTLAMETLLSLTSKRAGEWFKEELRELGGLEHIIKTICECCRQISDYVADWTNSLLEKLRKIERCLRVLENVTQYNEENQHYILTYNNGNAIDTLVKLYKLCDAEIALYPTTGSTPKDSPGVVIREALVPTLKVLINLTHPFDEAAHGCVILGGKDGIFDTSLHILLEAPNYVPEQCVFELSILVLLFLINLTTHTMRNRTLIMEAKAPVDFGPKFVPPPAIKALVQYFNNCNEMAKQVEQNTDDFLENQNKPETKSQSQEEYQETISKLLVQKAGNHMEHTMLASYASILIGNLINGSVENEKRIRVYFPHGDFQEMISVLEKYYQFMNLTANSEAVLLAHIKSTRKMIEDLRQRDIEHSTQIK